MKKRFEVSIKIEAYSDIQQAVDYYKQHSKTAAKKFYFNVLSTIKTLEKNALLFQTKYEQVRCCKVSKYPYLIHYIVDENQNTVRVFGVFNSYSNPSLYEEALKRIQ